MSVTTPEIIIVAGPNGAGKTSFANEFLPATEGEVVFVNADEIERGLTAHAETEREIRAGRIMLTKIDALAGAGAEFMFETTLASLTYAARISAWRQRGYHVGLVYLRLPNVEASIERVRRRVAGGGHDVPEETICRRFQRGLVNLEVRYKPVVNEWYVYDSMEGEFRLAESSEP